MERWSNVGVWVCECVGDSLSPTFLAYFILFFIFIFSIFFLFLYFCIFLFFYIYFLKFFHFFLLFFFLIISKLKKQ